MAPRPAGKPLSREQVLAAAIKLADGEGLQAITMRRLASSLGVEAMSLYHHLPGKEALFDGLVEAVAVEIQEEIGRADPGDGWRAQLRGRCLAARKVMLRHPWAPALIGSRQTIPPMLFLHFEQVMATLIGGGFSYSLGHRALHALGSMVLGFTQELFTPAAPDGDAATAATAGAAGAEADLAAMAEALPHLAAMVAAELHDADDPTLGWCDSQTEFEFTLDLLLDGLDRART
jgi:AcrR family transcriptional regulator